MGRGDSFTTFFLLSYVKVLSVYSDLLKYSCLHFIWQEFNTAFYDPTLHYLEVWNNMHVYLLVMNVIALLSPLLLYFMFYIILYFTGYTLSEDVVDRDLFSSVTLYILESIREQ